MSQTFGLFTARSLGNRSRGAAGPAGLRRVCRIDPPRAAVHLVKLHRPVKPLPQIAVLDRHHLSKVFPAPSVLTPFAQSVADPFADIAARSPDRHARRLPQGLEPRTTVSSSSRSPRATGSMSSATIRSPSSRHGERIASGQLSGFPRFREKHAIRTFRTAHGLTATSADNQRQGSKPKVQDPISANSVLPASGPILPIYSLGI